jgi:hypothetical protein
MNVCGLFAQVCTFVSGCLSEPIKICMFFIFKKNQVKTLFIMIRNSFCKPAENLCILLWRL